MIELVIAAAFIDYVIARMRNVVHHSINYFAKNIVSFVSVIESESIFFQTSIVNAVWSICDVCL